MFMNTKTVSVKKRTKNADTIVNRLMLDALIQLLKKKSISEITVTDITEKAGVSRMSYYRNFSSKEEILTRHLDEIFNDYIEMVKEQNYRGSCFDAPYLLQCFKYFVGQQKFLNCLLKIGMGDLILKHLTKYIMEFFYQDKDDIVLYYQLQALSGSIFNTYVAWQERNCRESLEQMAEIVSAIYRNVGILEPHED